MNRALAPIVFKVVDASQATHDDQRATVTVDRDGIILHWGDAVTEIVGHSANETLGRNLNIVIPHALRPVHWWGFDWTMRHGRPGQRETLTVPALRNDGRIVVAHATVELTAGSDGEIDGAVVSFVGTGARWQGMVWRAALAPIDAGRGIWQRVRPKR